jgi:FKBP-type peptidyl-prolyl cis-trans isomerase 2
MEGIELCLKETSDLSPPVPIVKGKRVLLQVNRLSGFNGIVEAKRKMDFIFGANKRKLIKGFETVLEQLNCGDLAEVRIASEKAYGKVGQSWEIGPDQDIYFSIQVLEVGEPSEQQTFQALSDAEKFAHSLELKEKANAKFKAGDLKGAIIIYKQAE